MTLSRRALSSLAYVLTLLSSTRLWAGLPSSSKVSGAGLLRVSGSRRPRQPAERPPRQKTVKGMEVWRARWLRAHTHTDRKTQNVSLTGRCLIKKKRGIHWLIFPLACYDPWHLHLRFGVFMETQDVTDALIASGHKVSLCPLTPLSCLGLFEVKVGSYDHRKSLLSNRKDEFHQWETDEKREREELQNVLVGYQNLVHGF